MSERERLTAVEELDAHNALALLDVKRKAFSAIPKWPMFVATICLIVFISFISSNSLGLGEIAHILVYTSFGGFAGCLFYMIDALSKKLTALSVVVSHDMNPQ